MRIEFPMMSIVSAALLIGCAISGCVVNVVSIELGFEMRNEASFFVHPIFLIEVPGIPTGGMAYGNVAMCDPMYSRWPFKETDWTRLKMHELRHCEQYHALGLLTWPASLVLNLEPDIMFYDHEHPERELASMWKPPCGWPDQWWLISIRLTNMESFALSRSH